MNNFIDVIIRVDGDSKQITSMYEDWDSSSWKAYQKTLRRIFDKVLDNRDLIKEQITKEE